MDQIRASSWDTYFYHICMTVADKSKDLSVKVGAVIVGSNNEIRSTGFNGFPRRVMETPASRHERPTKYLYSEHAERNAIYNAALCGIRTQDCVMYINFAPPTSMCADCARAIIQSGIREVRGPNRPFVSSQTAGKRVDYDEVGKHSSAMLSEAGVNIITFDLPG